MAIKYKEQTLEIDFTSTTPLSLSMMRADAVKWTFTFGEYDTTGATKLRVFVYMNGTNDYAFGNEFDITGSSWIATFASEKTAGYSGAAVMTVQLTDGTDVINSANVNLLIFDSKSQIPFSPSQEFYDACMNAKADAEAAASSAATNAGLAQNAAQSADSSANSAILAAEETITKAAQAQAAASTATTKATEAATAQAQAQSAANAAAQSAAQAQEISDPENRIGDLQISKLNSGKLYFKNGKVTTAAIALPRPFSVVGTFKYLTPDVTPSQWNPCLFNVGELSGAQTTFGLSMWAYYGATNEKFAIYYRSVASGTSLDASFVCNLFDGNEHTYAIILTPTLLKAYVDGEKLTSNTGASETDISSYADFTSNRTVRLGAGTDTKNFTESNFCIFNYDVSDPTAPYTLSDYIAGKSIPPVLIDPTASTKALLALENYTIPNGATKYVPDISGNSKDGTVSGSVVGDNDVRIEKLAQYINLQNT